ncbi:MAG: HAD family phosphatase [Bacteroidales bacterium]|nr:HAD family phosphatase [Bacteroidales bacterium]
MIKNLVFDFGGVIVDIDKSKAIRQFKEIGMADIEHYLGLYAQKGIFLEVEEGTIDDITFCKKLSELVGEELSYAEVKKAWLSFFLALDESRLDYIESLKPDYSLYILSNTNPFIQSWAQSPDFSSYGKSLNDYFDKIYTSYEIGYIKPHREIFDFMVKDANLNPSETLFIDDGPKNIEAAQKLGFKTYLVSPQKDWQGDLTELLMNDGVK